MYVVVGPVPSSSVIAYIKTARTELADLIGAAELTATLGPELLERFEAFHTEWEALAGIGLDFVWHRDLDAEETEWVVHGFFRTVAAVAARGGPSDSVRDEIRPFYSALVTGLLDALERESENNAAFAVEMRENWPFLTVE